MGMFMSFMGKGVPATQTIGYAMGMLHKQFVKKDIKNFEDFHGAILNIFISFNSALPGKHYDVPSRTEVEECFNAWISADEETKKKEVFVNFMKNKVSLSRIDAYTMSIGMATPPAVMAAKRAGEKLPQLNMIKFIPDVIFVPSATVLALISAKLTRRMLLENTSS
ncbi:hypothetical protein K2173_014799 [Erythroxylum novogranatense]|uniref:Calcium ion-binding protein n=1 Tax=Erythroxylum novogranatense TaxID=1862640 RepID=A0AAV8TFU3_9ROSI|nr:hypothetical protein K2173_014799 [Erythroxylum novogranatense]